MQRNYLFFYLMNKDLEKIRTLAPMHIKYWEENRPTGFSGGPFSDRSGGLILFEAKNLEVAEALAMNDPFVINQVINGRWIKEWMPAH